MCGICGIAQAQAAHPLPLQALEAMSRALAHRGPNDHGLWNNHEIALAHRRLSILDTSAAGRQPMHSSDGRFVVSFNGELYNFTDLREELIQDGHQFHTQCDTEVLLAAHQAWGDEAVERFNGMFAYALYDRDQKRLLIVRDRIGIKPLFYTLQNGRLLFASELQALRASGLIKTEINPSALNAYFTYLYIPAPESIYPQVKKLNPGEMLSFHHGKITLRKYWRLRYAVNKSLSLPEAGESFQSLLRDAVRLRRISDVPLGAFLSGGLDSSMVVSELAAQATQPIKTFSIGFDDKQANELRYARIAAKHFGADHTEAMLTPDMAALTPQIATHFGEPFADSSALPMWLVSQLARDQVTVALSGDGGDELFAGYTWAHMNTKVAAYRKVPRSLRSLIDFALALAPRQPRFNKIRRFSQDSFLPPAQSFQRRLSCFNAQERAALFQPALAQALSDQAHDRFTEHWDEAQPINDENAMLYLDSTMYLPDDILTKVDRMSMAHALEARVPLLDHRIVEFAATIPFALKYRQGVSKRVMKHAAAERLPKALLAQRKRGFAIPIHRWFRESLGAFFQESVLAAPEAWADYLRPAHLQHLFERHQQGKEHHGHQLWALLLFVHWLGQDQQAP